MCGKWWITQAGDITYAYTPELNTILQNIKSGTS